MILSTAEPNRFRLDAKTVIAGILLPAACFAGDFATRQHITGGAPAAFLTLYVLGCVALVLPAFLAASSKIWSLVAGTLATAALAVCLIALPISLFGGLAVAAAVDSLRMGVARGSAALSPMVFPMLGLGILGLGTLWTAWVFVQRSYLTLRTGLAAHGRRQSLNLGLFGAASLVGIVIGVDQIDRWWVTSQVHQISRTNPSELPTVLAKLSAYPLCGPERCARLVCKRLFAEFPGQNGFAFPPDIVDSQMRTLDAYFGLPAFQHCGWIASDGD